MKVSVLVCLHADGLYLIEISTPLQPCCHLSCWLRDGIELTAHLYLTCLIPTYICSVLLYFLWHSMPHFPRCAKLLKAYNFRLYIHFIGKYISLQRYSESCWNAVEILLSCRLSYTEWNPPLDIQFCTHTFLSLMKWSTLSSTFKREIFKRTACNYL